ncbi:Hypothetical protein CAP_4863 [Chondromyces apiculatus DSM 436]|uniref:Outer membrane protein beta-barrel domain-containing protein n=1 Tax=Chondromyces apiculatus DSM 436 TaxID=1192034 RepID=A0A017T5W1_9BACT|nr:Hypothetical protein CAP_4863 [Chondromyces apiculatus DSM 436]
MLGAQAMPQVQVAPEPSDHDRVVRKLAVGYLGLQTIRLTALGGIGLGSGSNQSTFVPLLNMTTFEPAYAPVIGIRYWFGRLVGLDAGVGFYFQSEETQGRTGDFESVKLESNLAGGGLHLGLPLALAHGAHYKFLIIPETNAAFVSGTAVATATLNGDEQTSEITREGFLFELGARIGSELHFGFIGVPELSLQAGVGVYGTYTNASRSVDGSVTDSSGSLNFRTTLQASPWAIMTGSLTALYYLP